MRKLPIIGLSCEVGRQVEERFMNEQLINCG